jgi:hypothetical protein
MIPIDRHNLPNDVDALKAIILQLLDIIDQQQRTIEEQQRIIRPLSKLAIQSPNYRSLQ